MKPLNLTQHQRFSPFLVGNYASVSHLQVRNVTDEIDQAAKQESGGYAVGSLESSPPEPIVINGVGYRAPTLSRVSYNPSETPFEIRPFIGWFVIHHSIEKRWGSGPTLVVGSLTSAISEVFFSGKASLQDRWFFWRKARNMLKKILFGRSCVWNRATCFFFFSNGTWVFLCHPSN